MQTRQFLRVRNSGKKSNGGKKMRQTLNLIWLGTGLTSQGGGRAIPIFQGGKF